MIDVADTSIPDVKLITPRRFGDARGWFSETWTQPKMAAVGLEFPFMQDNHSYSADVHTLRGLHYQAPPFAQTKLVRVARELRVLAGVAQPRVAGGVQQHAVTPIDLRRRALRRA